MTGIRKDFPGVRALAGVDFRLLPGEIHALLGENGAGKSTLIKVLTGVHPLDEGRITLEGRPVGFDSPQAAQRAGISTVYQEVNLCPNLSVTENIVIGREPRRRGPGGLLRGLIDWPAARAEARELLARFGLELDVTARLGDLPLAVQQLVAIVRAVAATSELKVLVLDEPTSSLDREETQRLFSVMRRLREQGVAVLFVTHFLDQIYEVCDRMTVLRNGALVGEYEVAELDQVRLVQLMIGKELDALEELTQRHTAEPGQAVGPGPDASATAIATTTTGRDAEAEPLLRATGLGRRGGIEPFDLELRSGEVLGLAGLLGSGRTELARLLFGADHADSGRLTVEGRRVALREPTGAIAHGLAYCSENRKTEGLVLELTVRENILLALQAARGWTRPVPAERREELVGRYIAALDIRPADPDATVGSLSGGNQQKVLLARWLITQPKLLILDEPTRGIDIGAKAEIQKLVVSLAEEGMGVLFISAELEEVLRLSHRVGVLRDRRLVAELPGGPQLTAARVMETIASGAGGPADAAASDTTGSRTGGGDTDDHA